MEQGVAVDLSEGQCASEIRLTNPRAFAGKPDVYYNQACREMAGFGIRSLLD